MVLFWSILSFTSAPPHTRTHHQVKRNQPPPLCSSFKPAVLSRASLQHPRPTEQSPTAYLCLCWPAALSLSVCLNDILTNWLSVFFTCCSSTRLQLFFPCDFLSAPSNSLSASIFISLTRLWYRLSLWLPHSLNCCILHFILSLLFVIGLCPWVTLIFFFCIVIIPLLSYIWPVTGVIQTIHQYD